MLYRENQKNGDKLSQLGFGCMRFPRRGAGIDIARSANLIHSAIEKGVNYFDTAYIYPGSEAALGQILASDTGKWREKVNIATKMPLFFVRSESDFDKFFARSLERLKTDYIEYYMLHMLTDFEYFDKLRSLGIENWIKKEKANGRIKNIGFSFHGNYNSFEKIVDAYDWGFCMIQYNYLDENYQAGTKGLKYAHSKNLPVIAMEPLRGGILANGLPNEAVREFQNINNINNNRTPADRALRWLWNLPEVTVVLSGMNTADQLEQNIKTAGEAVIGGMSEEELNAVKKVAEIMRAKIKVNCTGCGYCMPCPYNVDIPTAFACYNESVHLKRISIIASYMMSSGVLAEKPQFSSQCKKCGKCEKHCPQEIKIANVLGEASKYLEPFWVKTGAKILRRFTVGGVKNRDK